MRKEDIRIVFLGTPEFAVASLAALINAGYNVVGVITAPDRLGGRGRKKVIQSAIKQYALSKNIPVLQPPKLKNPEFLASLKALNADLQIVVAFRMLPTLVWDMPSLGTYNLHGSLLPKYRGAAPINWAIIEGATETGVTTFKLKQKMDSGNIAFQAAVTIGRGDYLNDIHDRLMEVGASLIVKTVDAICQGTIELKEQDVSKITHAPKIYHETGHLDHVTDPFTLYNKIRGLSPYPCAWITFDDKKLKVYKAKYSFQHHDGNHQFFTDQKSVFGMYCQRGLLIFDEIQLEGKRRMPVKMFLNGYNFKESKIQRLRDIQELWSR